MKLARWAAVVSGGLLAATMVAMTGNAAYADDPATLDVKGADTIAPGTPYDVQFVFTNDKARDLTKGEFVLAVANYDIEQQDQGTVAFKPGDVSVEYKAGTTWKKVDLISDDSDPGDPGLLLGLSTDAPSTTDKTTATYEFRVTLHAPSTLKTLSLGGILASEGAPEKTLAKREVAPKTARTAGTTPEIWAFGDKVLTVKAAPVTSSPTPSAANGGGGGSLPTTGASTGLLAAGGGLLVVAGCAIAVASRRRRAAGNRHAA